MRIVSYNTVAKNVNNGTYSVQDIGTFLGKKPHNIGYVANLFSQNSATILLDKLMNTHELKRTSDSYKNSNDMEFRWHLNVNKIKQVEITRTNTETGANGNLITLFLNENYYAPGDVISIEGSRDQLIVTMPPIMHSLNEWEYNFRHVTEDIQRGINVNYTVAGNSTRYRYNAQPEGSDTGYSKQDSNVEMHNNFLTLIRHDANVTGQMKLEESKYIEIGNPKSKEEAVYYKLDRPEEVMYNNFLESRSNALLFSRRNIDKDGNCNYQDNRGRNVPIGDGIITQAERYAEKHTFSYLTEKTIEDAIVRMRQKAQNPQNNQFVIFCNEKFDQMFHKAMKDTLKNYGDTAPAFYSKKTDSLVEVGASFFTYNWQSNSVSISVERELSREYSDRAYGIILNLSKDQELNRPAIELFTLEGASMITGTLKGLGGTTGKASGDIASPIHGMQHAIAGYCGAALYAPYNSFILEEAVTYYI